MTSPAVHISDSESNLSQAHHVQVVDAHETQRMRKAALMRIFLKDEEVRRRYLDQIRAGTGSSMVPASPSCLRSRVRISEVVIVVRPLSHQRQQQIETPTAKECRERRRSSTRSYTEEDGDVTPKATEALDEEGRQRTWSHPTALNRSPGSDREVRALPMYDDASHDYLEIVKSKDLPRDSGVILTNEDICLCATALVDAE